MQLQSTLLFYNDHYYGVTDTQTTQENGASFALSMSGQLAKIESDVENTAVLKLVQATTTSGSANDGGGARYVWLGLNDIAVEGSYTWQDGSALGSFNKWGSSGFGSEPDNFNGQQDGVGLAVQTWPLGSIGQWNDINITNSLMAVVEFDQAAFNTLNFSGKIIASNDDLVYIGANADESFAGGVGNDNFTGAGGNDTIDGGDGTDTVRFSGSRDEYSLTKMLNGSITVTDNTAGRDGIDTVRNIESLVFVDASLDPATIASLRELFAANIDTAKGLASAYEVLQGGVPNELGFSFLINSAVSTNFGAGTGVVFNQENIFINLVNNLVQGNADAKLRFDALATGSSLQEKVTSLYNTIIPASNQSADGLAFITRPEGLKFYEDVAAERGVAGTDGAAIVSLASLLKIAVSGNYGIGNAVNDLIESVAAGSAAIPENGTTLTPLETADGTAFDADDASAIASAAALRAKGIEPYTDSITFDNDVAIVGMHYEFDNPFAVS